MMKHYLTSVLLTLLGSLYAYPAVLGIFEDAAFPAPTTQGNGIARFNEIDGELYAPSANGIYKYTPTGATKWALFAMEGLNVLDFKVRGDEVIAIVAPKELNNGINDHHLARLYKAHVGSDGFQDITTDEMQYDYRDFKLTYLMRLAQNPNDSNEIMVATHAGVMRSKDFGGTWELLYDWCFSYNANQFLGWHPYMPGVMFYSSEGDFMNALILRSGNDGEEWEIVEPAPYTGDNSAHHIAFDPTHHDHLLLSGEGRIWESDDAGETFSQIYENNEELGYAYTIMFNPKNAAEAYCVGCNSLQQSIAIFKSSDNGRNWDILAKSGLFSNHHYWVSESFIFDNKIFIYTRNGILTYDLNGGSGIDNVAAEENQTSVRYYNLQGVELPEEPQGPGVYIERRGDSSSLKARR